jgi:hypothetical protein
MNILNTIKKRSNAALALLAMFFTSNAVRAADFDIGDSPDGAFDQIIKFTQDVVNALSGPGMLAVAFVSIFVVVVLWVFAPKAGPVMAMAMRVGLGVIILLNVPLWITYFTGS